MGMLGNQTVLEKRLSEAGTPLHHANVGSVRRYNFGGMIREVRVLRGKYNDGSAASPVVDIEVTDSIADMSDTTFNTMEYLAFDSFIVEQEHHGIRLEA